MSKVICHFTTVHYANDTRINLKECESLSRAGYTTHLVYFGPEYYKPDSNIILHRIDAEATSRVKRMFVNVYRIYKFIRQLNADLYHFHDPELLPIGLLLKVYGKKVIYDVHEDLPRQILSKDWIPAYCRNIISTIAEKIENMAVKYLDATVGATYHISKRFESICQNAVDINNYPILDELIDASVSWSEKEKAVCYAGSITAIRGIKEMITAVGMTDSKLLLAGDFSPANLQEEMQKLPEWEQVDYLGYLGRSEVKKVYSQSMAGLVVLYPQINYLDSQPIKLFEYMSAGIPVIASDFFKWRKIVEENHCGICVNPLDSKAIAQAIAWIINNPAEARKMGENGRRAIEKLYNWGNEEKKLVALYQHLA